MHDCELYHGVGSKIKCEKSVPTENSVVNMLSNIWLISPKLMSPK